MRTPALALALSLSLFAAGGPAHAASLARGPGDGAPFQIFTGPTFNRLAAEVETLCPSSRIRYTHTADLLDFEDQFEEGLSTAERQRIERWLPRDPDGGISACRNFEGAGCDAATVLSAIDKAGLLKELARAACRKGAADW